MRSSLSVVGMTTSRPAWSTTLRSPRKKASPASERHPVSVDSTPGSASVSAAAPPNLMNERRVMPPDADCWFVCNVHSPLFRCG